MNLQQYKQTIEKPLGHSTLCLLVKEDQVLLAMKKRGFGEGKWNGVGGKKEIDETIEECAIRETEEEIGVKAKEIEQVAILDFYFPNKPSWDQRVFVFLIANWEGYPKESEEMRPVWYDFNDIPYESMWADDKIWLKKVLKGEKLKAEFMFDENSQIVEHDLEIQ